MYTRFFISGRDIAAFFTDCGFERQNCTLVSQHYNNQQIVSSMPDEADNFCPLVDRCGMAVLIDQV